MGVGDKAKLGDQVLQNEYSDESGSDSDSGDSSCEEDTTADQKPQRFAFVVVTCVIGGYALIGPLQHDLKHHLKISDSGAVSEMFTYSVALVQWGKTVMTMAQNIVFGCVQPVHRVYIAMSVMLCGTLVPPLFVFSLGSSWLGWVPMCYGMVGLSLGVFESTFMSVITPLGPQTKSWAIMGFPTAFAIVNILGQSLKALIDMPVAVIFWYIFLCQPFAIFLFSQYAPHDTKVDGKSYKQTAILVSFQEWNQWLVKMIPFSLVNIMSHFVMELVLPAAFNTYNAPQVSLLGPNNDKYTMKTSWFIVLFSACFGGADIISRRFGYLIPLAGTSSFYTALGIGFICSLVGLYLTTQGIAMLALFSAFLAFFGSGFNYAVTARYIDRDVPRKHNLAAYSLWMFVGYGGAIAGSMLPGMVRQYICNGSVSQYQCLSH